MEKKTVLAVALIIISLAALSYFIIGWINQGKTDVVNIYISVLEKSLKEKGILKIGNAETPKLSSAVLDYYSDDSSCSNIVKSIPLEIKIDNVKSKEEAGFANYDLPLLKIK